MKYYAVIDTNVVVSSMLKNDSIPGSIVNLVEIDIIIPLISEEILTEYSDVLTRNKFGFSSKMVNHLLDTFKAKGIYLNGENVLENFIGKDDIVFFRSCYEREENNGCLSCDRQYETLSS